jgi:hypothetical protein
MQTIYVSNRGSDENDGETRATPVYSWRRVNALCQGIHELRLIEGDATLIRLKTEIDECDRKSAVKPNPSPAELSDYNQEERARIVDEMKSILGYRDTAGPPHEEVLNLTEQRAASNESDEEVLHLTEELIPRQAQDAPLWKGPGPEEQGQAGVFADATTDASEVSLTDSIEDIQRQIDEALAPLKNDNYERVLVRTENPNPAQIQPDDTSLILKPDPTSAHRADITASAPPNLNIAAAAQDSLPEFQIDAKMIGDIQRKIDEALAPLKDTGCAADEEVLNLTEELIPGGQTRSDGPALLAVSKPENEMQAHVYDNPPRTLSTATRAAEGSLPESDAETNLDIQRRIAEALSPLKNRSCDEGDEVLHLTEALITGKGNASPLSGEPKPEKQAYPDLSAITPRNSTTAAHAAEGLVTESRPEAHKTADIQRQIAEALAPLKPPE